MCTKRILFFVLFSLNLTFLFPQCKLKVVDREVHFGMHHRSNRKIDALIIHSAYNSFSGDKYNVDLVIRQFHMYHVSAHYMIGRNGTIYRLVKEKDIAYHAGKSRLPDGRTAVNSCSIGIEVITDSIDLPTSDQLSSLVALVNDIRKRYKIKYVLRHSDIAPERKTDPWNLNWEDFLRKIGCMS